MMYFEQRALVHVFDAYRRGASLALLFDYDGTLVPIAEHPRMAVLSTEAQRRLDRLARTPSVFVGVLSGRSIDDLKRAVGLDGLCYVGTSGLELDLWGLSITHPKSTDAAQIVGSVVGCVGQVLTGYPSAWMEQKPLGLTVHYRGVEAQRIEALRTRVERAIEPFSPRLHVDDGPMAIEITPNLGWTKCSALEMIIGSISASTVLPLYAGDDANDADALSAAAVRGGVAIGIGPRAPLTARYHLPDPPSLERYLDALLEIL
jgi:trehalose 6-phosphate phosphatase